MEIIKIPLSDLTPDPNNAKDHPDWQIEQIKNSIEQFGNLDPIGVWGENNLIVEGNGRLEALKELGYTEAECIRLDWLTEEERRAYSLAHNKINQNSGFIPEALDTNLAAVGEIDMSLFGFDADKVDNSKSESAVGDYHSGGLTEEFGQPPFSVLNATKGDWLERKRLWISLGIRSEVGRGGETCFQFKEQSRGKLHIRRSDNGNAI